MRLHCASLLTLWRVSVLVLLSLLGAKLDAQPLHLLTPVSENTLTAGQQLRLANMRIYLRPQGQSYVVTLNASLIETSARVTFNFSRFSAHPDLTFDRVQLEHEMSAGDFTWIGKGSLDHLILSYNDVVITSRGGVLVLVSIWAGSEKIMIWPLGGGVHAVIFPGSPTPSTSGLSSELDVVPQSAPLTQPPVGAARAPTAVSATSLRNNCSELTVVAFFTATALAELNVHVAATMHQWLRHQVSVGNLAYANSGVYTRLKLVGVHQTGYVEPVNDTVVGNADMKWLSTSAEVSAQRQASEADLAVLITRSNRPFTGLAGFNSAFIVMVSTAFVHDTVLVHEIGHLQGLGHSGVCNAAGGWRTLMTSDTPCTEVAEVIPYFTNPLLARDGISLGSFTGGGTGDFEVQTISASACRIASFEGPPAEITSFVGDDDGFLGPDIATRSLRVQQILEFVTADTGFGAGNLDEVVLDRPVGFSAFFNAMERGSILYPTSAKLRMRLRGNALSFNDAISLSSITSSPSEQDQDCQQNLPSCIRQPLFPVVALRDLLGREPVYGETYDVTIDFARVPLRTHDTTGGPGGHWSASPDEYRSLLGTLVQRGEVGVVVGDDTQVDFAELTMTAALRYPLPYGQKLEDMNADGVVDHSDVNIILGGRGTKAYVCSGCVSDPRDLDGDGMITVNDARRCVVACTYPNCAGKSQTQ